MANISRWGGALFTRILPVSLFTFLALSLGAFTNPASAQGLPSGWKSTDIGSPAITGSGAGDLSAMTVRGSGTGLDGTNDEFQFTYEKLSGDVDMVMRLDSLDSSIAGAKAGLMIRDTLETYSKYAYVGLNGTRAAFQWRDRNARVPSAKNGPSASGGVWLRIVRSDNDVTVYSSDDGSTWSTIGTARVRMTTDVLVGMAVTSSTNTTSATATYSESGVTANRWSPPATSLPAPWVASDIGSPAITGSASYSNGTFTVNGAGNDIWNTADQFQYVYQPMSGDGEIVAYVSSLTVADPWSKGGIMIRDGLGNGVMNAGMFATAQNGWSFQRRPAKGGLTYSTKDASGVAPGWLRLVREGNLFTGYFSKDGTTWTMLDSDTLPMASTAYVGLAVTSHNTGASVTSTFKNVTVGKPTSSNKAPSVSITSPASGASYGAGASISIVAAASDVDGSISKVDLYAGSTLLKSDSTSPYSVTWNGVAAGTYTIKAVATDNAGDTTTSAGVTVTVGSSNKAPSVAITSPSNGATYTVGSNIAIAATASDTDGSIAKVDFYAGSTLLKSDTSSPYSVTWSGVPAGTYGLKAVATDNDGDTTTSGTITVSVGASNKLPTVSLTSPIAGLSFTAPASIGLTASASDSDGSIAKVEFYAGNTLIGTDTSSPYSVSWTGVAAGSYTLKAVATDNQGGVTTSAGVGITVSPGSTATPSMLTFTPPSDYATNVTSVTVELRKQGTSTTSTPAASKDLGKPSVSGGSASIDISSTVNGLASGTYYAIVVTKNSVGSTASSASPTFTK